MKSLKIKLSVCIVFIALTLSLSITSCHKENEVVEFDQMENPDKEKGQQGEDKVNEKPDTLTMPIAPLNEADKLEKIPEISGEIGLRAAYQNRVKVIVTLKSIQCISVADGRFNTNNSEELYGWISASLCARIAPNNQCETSANLRFNESVPYQRITGRYRSTALFEVDRSRYLLFPRFKIVNTNSKKVFDYDAASAYFPNIKLGEDIKENDFDGFNDSDDSYYFINGTPTIYLAHLTYNTVHIFQSQFGDSSSRYTATYTIQKIYY